MAPDSLQLSRTSLVEKLPFDLPAKPAHGGGWDDLGQVVTTMVFSPAASLVGAGIGFLIGGPVGAAIGAAAGGSALGIGFSVKNLVHHLTHVARKEDTGEGYNLKLAGTHLILPGLTAAGAGIGFAIGGPVGAAVGGVLGSGAIALVMGASLAIERLRRTEPQDTVPEPAPNPAQ
jgi:hypothetical protein